MSDYSSQMPESTFDFIFNVLQLREYDRRGITFDLPRIVSRTNEKSFAHFGHTSGSAPATFRVTRALRAHFNRRTARTPRRSALKIGWSETNSKVTLVNL